MGLTKLKKYEIIIKFFRAYKERRGVRIIGKIVCGHSSHVSGAPKLIELVLKVGAVRSCRGGRLRMRTTSRRGVEIRRARYNLIMTIYAEDGIQTFSINPQSNISLEELEENVSQVVSRHFNLIGREEEMPKRTRQQRKEFLQEIYEALQEISVDAGGVRVVKNIRTYLRDKFGLSETELNGIQADKSLLVPVGNERPAVYRLITPKGYEAEDVEPELTEVVEEVQSEVEQPCGSKPVLELGSIPTDLQDRALYALLESDEKLVACYSDKNEQLLRDLEEMESQMAKKRAEFQSNAEKSGALQDEITTLINILESR